MEVVRLLLRAELRRRWRSWLTLAALIGLVGGVVLGAAAAGRRTAAAFPSFVAAYGFDAAVFHVKPIPSLDKLAEVSSVVEEHDPFTGQPTCTCRHTIDATNFSVDSLSRSSLAQTAKLVAGVMPADTAPDQVLASITLQQDSGVQIGTRLRVPMEAPAQLSAALNATGALPTPHGPTITFRVVGIAVSEQHFPSGGPTSYDIYTTDAFAHSVLPRTANATLSLVRLRHGGTDFNRFQADLTSPDVLGVNGEDGPARLVIAAIHPQAAGWWVLAGLAALAGLAVIGSALNRESVSDDAQHGTLAALGVEPRGLVGLGLARTLIVGIVGAVIAVAVAVGLSPLAPVGEARTAVLPIGPSFDATVLLLGALAIVGGVLALGVWPAVRASRIRVESGHRLRRSATVGLITGGSPSPSALVGIRHAFLRAERRTGTPVGTAILGTVLAVTALCGTAVFGTSLAHLTTTPALYGDAYQAAFYGSDTGTPPTELAELEHDPVIDRITLASGELVTIRNVSVKAAALTAIRGPILASVASGQFPATDHEIALGSTTMHQVGAHLGSVVPVTFQFGPSRTRTVAFRVVATAVFPTGIGNAEVSLGTGAAWTPSAYIDAACPPGPKQSSCKTTVKQKQPYSVLAAARPGQQGRADIARYLAADQSNGSAPGTPTALVNFGEAVNFPLIFGVMLGLFGTATLIHLLIVSVARRRQETAILRALGFVNRQVAAAVRWQATAVAIIGIAIGVPLGVATGQIVWRAFATNLGVVPLAITRPPLIAGLAIAVVLAANLIAIGPALAATHANPATALRTTN